MPFGGDIQMIRENFDTSNPVTANVLKAKEEQLKMLQEMNRSCREEMAGISHMTPQRPENGGKRTVIERRKSEPVMNVRRSKRLQNLSRGEKKQKISKPESPKSQILWAPVKYGSIPGVMVGTHWETRMECSKYGVHRPTVAGIHGGPDGAYSIALSGGYPEDVDEGNSFLYTGAGGRDLKGTSRKPKNLRTAPQTKDQELVGPNLSLVRSIQTGNPVRVVRGYKSSSVFAPRTGYRYDGLYLVVQFWEDVGATGFRIYRFKMVRIKDQAPPPWDCRVSPKNFISPSISFNGKTDAETHPKRGNIDKNEFPSFRFNHSENEESIPPNTSLISLNLQLNFSRVMELENQIETCIKFFFEVSATSNNRNFESGHHEEFHGWNNGEY